MADNNLLGRLDGLVSRFEEVGTLITDPAVIADMKRFVKLNKEYRDLEKIVVTRNEYVNTLNGIKEARQLLETEQDPEMREIARDELDACNARIPELEEEIKLLLVPSDPEDDKNAIVEIRGGTGGDEAALFAGDLYRMYMKYCETKGWKVALSSCSEGSSGGYKEIIFTVSGEKAYGTLKYARSVSSSEAKSLLSDVMLGQSLGRIPKESKIAPLECMVLSEPALVCDGKELSPNERDKKRAELIRNNI